MAVKRIVERALEQGRGAAYGFIMMQGHGTLGVWDIEPPTMIRYGQLTYDEYFVTEQAAKKAMKP